MFDPTCKDHPLKRDGRSQSERRLAALSPSSLSIDNRKMEDFLVFFYEFAKQVNYYDIELNLSDWVPFFEQSAPFQIAFISKFELEDWQSAYQTLSEKAATHPTEAAIYRLMDKQFDLLRQIDSWATKLRREESAMQTRINNLIESNLKSVLSKLLSYHNAIGHRAKYNPFTFQNAWALSPADLFKVDASLAQTNIDTGRKLQNLHTKLDELSQVIFKATQEIIKDAPELIEESLRNNQSHAPHIGLMITFIQLFQNTITQLNGLNEKHLHFFYEKVLQLKKQPAVPDHAHLIFELNKKIEHKELQISTRFKAGKDEAKAEIQFQLDRQLVVQKAQVAQLKTLYLDLADGKTECGIVQGTYFSPTAHSADGLGGKFAGKGLQSWKTLGSKESKTTITPAFVKAYQQSHPFAHLGFILASPVLLLNEGTRKITITFTLDDIALNVSGSTSGAKKYNSNNFRDAIEKVYQVITEDTLKAAQEEGMKPAIAEYFKRYMAIAMTDGQLNEIINKRAPLDKRDDNDSIWLKKYTIISRPLKVALSGKKGWMELTHSKLNPLEPYHIQLSAPDKLEIIITLAQDADPLAFYDPKIFGLDYKTEMPMVRVYLDPTVTYKDDKLNHEPVALYHVLQELTITDIKITTDVVNVKKVFVETKDGTPDTAKPFFPFGGVPKLNDFFLVGSLETIIKKLTQLTINVTWEGLPKYFAEHYSIYYKPVDPTGERSGDYQTSVVGLNAGVWKPINDKLPLFSVAPDGNIIISNTKTFTFNNPTIGTATIEKPADLNIAKDLNGLLKFQLTPKDFKHSEYSVVLNKQTAAMTASSHFIKARIADAIYIKNDTPTDKKIGSGITDADLNNYHPPLPNPPYTPTIQEISIDYAASAAREDITFIHLHPEKNTFERIRLPEKALVNTAIKPHLFPHFTDEGTLYIGLQDFIPGSVINLLFQMSESTANPDLEQAVVQWQYLHENRWSDLRTDFEILSDDTNGLINSGVVRIAVPRDITKNNTILQPALHWLKVATARRTAAIAETIAVHAQAERVTFENRNNDLTRLAQPLPAGAIAKPVESISELKGIQQLYDSFGGRPQEGHDTFYLRVSERLRHKGRGVTLFDYETLILQEFPQIYTIKCITHTLGRKSPRENQPVKDHELAPGFVTVAVIPDVEANLPFAAKLQPKATLATLEAIERFLKQHISPFIRLKVLNPLYELVHISAEIQFRKGFNEAFYQKKLEQEVTEFLTPWASGGNSQISFGGKMSKSTIINYIERLPYVDFIKNLKMLDTDFKEQEEIFPKTARSILAAGTHIFTPTSVAIPNQKNATMQGLGYERLGSKPWTIKN